MTLQEKGALVTGATSGIGAAVALRLASEGANTVITGRDPDKGRAVAERLEKAGSGRCRFIAADLASPEAPLLLAEQAEEWLGGVDILVNNAATGGAGHSTEITPEDWDAIFAVNVRAPYLLSTAVMRRMSERRSGVVVNVTTSVAYRGWPGYSAYASSKAALDAMSRCWAATYGLWGVRVNTIAPGPVLTEGSTRESKAEDIAEFCAGFGAGRYGTVDEVAAAVSFLVSDEAEYIHASTIHIDGGMVETFGYQPISVRTVAREPGSPEPQKPAGRKRLLDRFRRPS
jgi:NAD(P)-dependent dehydrogenase (short-subunit alcohol dehydrogenase family)